MMATTTERRATPIVKWAGGKSRLLPELLARVPSSFGRYYEPFAGGAALFFRLAPDHAVLGDSNSELISMYQTVRDEPERVIELLRHQREMHSRSLYYATREAWNGTLMTDRASRAATFIYLNKTCFNGLWRVNRAGSFNVPMGRYDDPAICVPEAIRAASDLLRTTTLRHGQYGSTIADARRGDFVYFDPPYDGTFVSYTAGGFGTAQQAELALTVRMLATLGCMVMVSNADTPCIRELYSGMRIDRVKCGRGINSNITKRGEVDEVIVTAGYAWRAA